MDDRLRALLEDLKRVASLPVADRNRCARRAPWLAEAKVADQREFLRAVRDLPLPLEEPQDVLLKAAFASLVQKRQAQAAANQWKAERDDPAELTPEVVALYRGLGPPSRARGPLLAWLAIGGTHGELSQLADLLVDDPPSGDADVVRALAPLFQQRRLDLEALFPRLLEALAHLPLAAAVLDLANHAVRSGQTKEHPAAPRKEHLQNMLGTLVGMLSRLSEAPELAGDSPAEVSRRVQHSVALAVSLCDALALLGDAAAIPKLHQALSLSHRRLKTEAAAALARLGDPQGKPALIELAAEAVARLRVLAYAKELGFADQIDRQYRSPQARAEAELTVWLAEPTQYGIPPSACELIDHRRQSWPGYSEPVDCFLFRFTYAITDGNQQRAFSSIGIAGPLTHAFTADLADLPPDDIYAAFAGWQAEHEEIKEFDVARLSKSEQTELARLVRRLHDAGYEQIEPRTMGYFFGERALSAEVRQGGLAGAAVADAQEILFFPARQARRSIGPAEAYCIYKGRKLLRTFNR